MNERKKDNWLLAHRCAYLVLAPAENPRGTPVFHDLVIDPPASENEFTVLWKLYFATLLHDVFVEYGVKCDEERQLTAILAGEGLIPSKATLQSLLKGAFDYVRWMARPQSVEAGVEMNGSSPGSVFFKGKISFTQPSIEQAKSGVLSVDQLLQLANAALSKCSDFTVWLLLDRLDVAFADNPDLEQNALRALFHVYLDMLGLSNIRLKIFLRTDIWKRLSSGGFREASHIVRTMNIDWNRSSLLNLVIRRALYNANLSNFYGVNPSEILISTAQQESFFYKMCPDQVDIGPNKPKSFDWMLGRTRDGFGKNAPREIIHLLNCLKSVQIRRFELGEAVIGNGRLFERSSFKLALPQVSQVRLEQTLYAEYPSLRNWLEKLREQKTQQTLPSLSSIWGTSPSDTATIAHELVEVGFFEQRGSLKDPQSPRARLRRSPPIRRRRQSR